MRIEHSAARLVARDTPGCLWLFGLVFVASGSFVLGSVPLAPDWAGFSGWERLAVFAIGISHLGGGLWLIRQHPTTRLELDRARGSGRLTRRYPGDRAATVTRFSLTDLRDVRILERRDSDGDPCFAISLVLADGRELPLHGAPVSARTTVVGWARPLRQFLGLAALPEPPRPS
jgi:hypothetical protein